MAWRQPWRRWAGDDRERERAAAASAESGSAKGSLTEEERALGIPAAAAAAAPVAGTALAPKTGKEEKGAEEDDAEATA